MKTGRVKSKVKKPSTGEDDIDIAVLKKKVDLVLKDHDYDRGQLISILLAIQEEYNYLPKESLKIVAEALKIRLIDAYSVATFYQVFSLVPRGKHIINVCVGTACHVRGSRRIVDQIMKKLEIEVGGTTPDKQFTLETVRCLGACALGPVMVVDKEYHGQMSTDKIDPILLSYRKTGGKQCKAKS